MKIFIIAMLIISNAFAASRVEEVMTEDTMKRLSAIQSLQSEIQNTKNALSKLDEDLQNAENTESREKVFIMIRNSGAVLTAASLFATTRFFYKAKLAKSEGGLYNLIIAYAGTAITAGTAVVLGVGQVGMYLSKNEANNLRNKIQELNNLVTVKENDLKNEIQLLCKDDQRHQVCY